MKCIHTSCKTAYCPHCGKRIVPEGVRGEVLAWVYEQEAKAQRNVNSNKEHAAPDLSRVSADRKEYVIHNAERAKEDIPRLQGHLDRWSRWRKWLESLS